MASEKRNCPTCDTVGIAGDGRQCWTCGGRGWVGERVAGRTVDLPRDVLAVFLGFDPGPSSPR